MAKLRVIFTGLVIVACVLISECRVEDSKSQRCEELAAKVEKKLAELEPETVTLSSGYSSFQRLEYALVLEFD